MGEVMSVSHKYQVVIPQGVREKLGIRKGDLVEVKLEDEKIIMQVVRRRYTDRLRGLGKDTWKNVDPVEYQRQEREGWRKREERITVGETKRP